MYKNRENAIFLAIDFFRYCLCHKDSIMSDIYICLNLLEITKYAHCRNRLKAK